MTTSEQLSDLDNRIVGLIRECWEEQQTPLLLSRLGKKDDGDIMRETRQKTGSLKTYLIKQLAEHVRVIQHSTRPSVVGAVPADAEAGATNSDVDELLERTQGNLVKTTSRFHPAFWAAFRKPLDVSRQRYMKNHPPFHFQDLATAEDPPDGCFEVEREYVVGPDGEVAEVQKKAQDWLAAKNLQPMFFLKGKTGGAHLPSNDLLGRLLLALEPDELRRMSIPLDIVSKLRQHSL